MAAGFSIFDISSGKIVVPDAALNKVSALLPKSYVGVITASQAGLPSALLKTDRNNIAPRIGLAWRPLSGSRRFVVRSGYGIYYDVLDRYYDVLPFTVNQPYILPALPNTNGLESQPPLDMRSLFPTPLPIGQQQFAPPYCQVKPVSSCLWAMKTCWRRR